MRFRPLPTAGRVAALAATAAGAVVGVQHVSAAPVSRATHAACAAKLPGTGARCDTDHAVASVGPSVGPALLGGIAGLVVALLALVVLRAVVRALRPRASTPSASAVGPSWTVPAARAAYDRVAAEARVSPRPVRAARDDVRGP